MPPAPAVTKDIDLLKIRAPRQAQIAITIAEPFVPDKHGANLGRPGCEPKAEYCGWTGTIQIEYLVAQCCALIAYDRIPLDIVGPIPACVLYAIGWISD
jgi:hypothetical protein